MEPKDKAKELFDKFDELPIKMWDDQGSFIGTMQKDEAKECALIAVDVILNDVGAKDWENDNITGNNYWLEVKKEIENL